MLGHDSDWWNIVLLISLAVGAIGAVGVGFASLMSVLAAKSEMSAYKATVSTAVSDAKARGIEAGAKAATATLAAEHARERAAAASARAAEASEKAAQVRKAAAELESEVAAAKSRIAQTERNTALINQSTARYEKEAADTRLKLASVKSNVRRINNALASRHLTIAQRHVIVLLHLKGYTVVIRANHNGEELAFALELRSAFLAAGANVPQLGQGNTIDNGSQGLVVHLDPTDPIALKVLNALAEVGLKPRSQLAYGGSFVIEVAPRPSTM